MKKPEKYQTWDGVFHSPHDIRLKTLYTGYLIGSEKGMFNIQSKMYQHEFSFKRAELPVLVHLISYNDKHYLIDTGFDSSFSQRWGGSFKGFLRPLYYRNRYFQPDSSLGIEKQLEAKSIALDGIFLTHAHEHSAGLGAFDSKIPLILGKDEHDINFFPLVYSTNIKSRKNVQYLNFDTNGIHMPLLGSCIDLFHDGSFWAIDTNGHTKGHVSYLINGLTRKVLITGDAANNSLGFSSGIETGSYSEDKSSAKASFNKLIEFSNAYPEVEIIFGHEVPGVFDIRYIY